MNLQDYYNEIGAYLSSKFPEGITQETANGICASLKEEVFKNGMVIMLEATVQGEQTRLQATIPPEDIRPLLTWVRTKKMEVTGV
jgi:hypothetical protein